MIDIKNISEEKKISLLNQAYDLAFKNEQKYGCCPQCVIGSIMEVFELDLEQAFKSSYGLGGGAGLCSRGTCGAVVGGIMVISSLIGRSYKDFTSGRNPECYAVSRNFLEAFQKEYGTILCGEVQTKIMGNSYDLANKNEVEAFEKAGGHEDKCPSVCGFAAKHVSKMILEGEVI
jgi:C_GCAxxG_C_C family probable redox protein